MKITVESRPTCPPRQTTPAWHFSHGQPAEGLRPPATALYKRRRGEEHQTERSNEFLSSCQSLVTPVPCKFARIARPSHPQSHGGALAQPESPAWVWRLRDPRPHRVRRLPQPLPAQRVPRRRFWTAFLQGNTALFVFSLPQVSRLGLLRAASHCGVLIPCRSPSVSGALPVLRRRIEEGRRPLRSCSRCAGLLGEIRIPSANQEVPPDVPQPGSHGQEGAWREPSSFVSSECLVRRSPRLISFVWLLVHQSSQFISFIWLLVRQIPQFIAFVYLSGC